MEIEIEIEFTTRGGPYLQDGHVGMETNCFFFIAFRLSICWCIIPSLSKKKKKMFRFVKFMSKLCVQYQLIAFTSSLMICVEVHLFLDTVMKKFWKE